MIPIYIPYLDKYKNSALMAISTNWISNYGIFVKNSVFNCLSAYFETKKAFSLCRSSNLEFSLFSTDS